jgi:hypothetical protein
LHDWETKLQVGKGILLKAVYFLLPKNKLSNNSKKEKKTQKKRVKIRLDKFGEDGVIQYLRGYTSFKELACFNKALLISKTVLEITIKPR